jgi:hypothetical protein
MVESTHIRIYDSGGDVTVRFDEVQWASDATVPEPKLFVSIVKLL